MKKTLVLLLIFSISKYCVAKSIGEMERAPKSLLSGWTDVEGNLRYCSKDDRTKCD